MTDWLSARAQAAHVQLLAMTQAKLERSRYFAALINFSETPSGEIILQNWVQTVLLKPCTTPEDMGEQRFLLRLLQDLRNAMSEREAPAYESLDQIQERFHDGSTAHEWGNPAGEWGRAEANHY